MRARISASGPFASGIGVPPVRHRAREYRPTMLTVGAAKRQNFRTCRKRLGCPTGQTGRSSRTAHRLFSPSVTQELPGDLYDHKTILGLGEPDLLARSRNDAGTVQFRSVREHMHTFA